MKRDIAIVGSGILGLAHAWSAQQRGHHVTVFERSSQAEGASVRNFGMIWPIGQADTPMESTAMLSHQRWQTVAERAGCWLNRCGSLHLAHHDDELSVLEEFVARTPAWGDASFEVLDRDETLRRAPGANPAGLRGALWSPFEMGVNPRQACAIIAKWLANVGVVFRYCTAVTELQSEDAASQQVLLSDATGERQHFSMVVVCAGSDFQTLLPDVFAGSGLRPCKLQMMRTVAQPAGWRIGPHLASGLTLRHYANFGNCPSLKSVRQRYAIESPELDTFGIHVMASQDNQNQVILGDSHEFDEDVAPFDKAIIDQLMLRELHKVFTLPDWTIAERWHGIYAKHVEPVFQSDPLPNVHVCTGVGGAGMTLSFGIAERTWQHWDDSGRFD